MSVRKCAAEFSFEALEFVPIHRHGTEVADGVGCDEIVKGPDEAAV
jgi:hypothetical protein